MPETKHKTNIGWTHYNGTIGATWNPIRGVDPNRWICEKISPGCESCYASSMNHRFGGVEYPHVGDGHNQVRLDDVILRKPMTWRDPHTVFVCSMTDLFGEWVPDEWILEIWLTMMLTPEHTYQVLTKRPQRMADVLQRMQTPLASWPELKMFSGEMWPAKNIWLGTTVEEDRYMWRAGELMAIDAPVHFLSLEPLLGGMNSLRQCLQVHERGRGHGNRIDWVIAGGESNGPENRRLVDTSNRPSDFGLEWVRGIRDDCLREGVPWYFKQWGGARPTSGGRELDGRTWDQFPEVER